MRFPTPVLAAGVMAASLAAIPRSSPAQLVPRLVDYPVAQTNACVVDRSTHLAERRVGYPKSSRREDVQVYAESGCGAASLLFTISVASMPAATTITPTAGGVAFLNDRCAQYAWRAGVAQDVTSDPCTFVAPVLGSL